MVSFVNRGKGNAWKIILLGLLAVILAVAAFVLFPGTRSFDNVYELTSVPEWKYVSEEDYMRDDHGYHYLATGDLYRVYVDSYVDLSQELQDNDTSQTCNLGAQELNLKFTGIRMFTEDRMGVMVKYPVFVYEYAG